MAVQMDGPGKTFLATTVLAAFRRVKMTAASGTYVEYATGAAGIGITQEPAAAIGDAVTVRLAGRGHTSKVAALTAFAAGAVLYGAADGKVDDAVNETAIGTALEAAGANGDVVEMLEDNGAAGSIGPDATVNEASAAAIPILIRKVCAFNATPDPIAVATASRKMRIVDWWLRAIDNTAASITVKNAATSISTAALAKGATVDAIVRAVSIVEAQAEVALGAAITVESSAASADIELYILCVPVA